MTVGDHDAPYAPSAVMPRSSTVTPMERYAEEMDGAQSFKGDRERYTMSWCDWVDLGKPERLLVTVEVFRG